jgi:predicted PhzF superfamily epimerase YddE/YHI9
VTTVEAWWGRVFAQGGPGGNHTVVVVPGRDIRDPAAVAARLAVPDTGFITSADAHHITLRTFSPVEELAQCLQTSLAALTALGVANGERRLVRHPRGEPLEVHREAGISWARETDPGVREQEPTGWPAFVAADPAIGAEPVVLRQARSRAYLRLADDGQLLKLDIGATDVLELCHARDISGLVLSAVTAEGVLRVRVFTTSLSGREDNATGGAVLGAGRIAARDGLRGDVTVVQGPVEPDRQGHFALRLTSGGDVLLGGSVETLIVGGLAA